MNDLTRRSFIAALCSITALCGMVTLSLMGCAKSPELLSVSGKPIEFWLDALKAPSTDAKQRLKAVHALSNVGPAHPQAIPALIDALEQTDPAVRDEVVLALLKIGPSAKESLVVLERVSQSDKDTQVRDLAEKAIKAIRGE